MSFWERASSMVCSWEDTSDQEHCIVGSNKALKSIWENFCLLVCFVWLYFKESVLKGMYSS